MLGGLLVSGNILDNWADLRYPVLYQLDIQQNQYLSGASLIVLPPTGGAGSGENHDGVVEQGHPQAITLPGGGTGTYSERTISYSSLPKAKIFFVFLYPESICFLSISTGTRKIQTNVLIFIKKYICGRPRYSDSNEKKTTSLII